MLLAASACGLEEGSCCREARSHRMDIVRNAGSSTIKRNADHKNTISPVVFRAQIMSTVIILRRVIIKHTS